MSNQHEKRICRICWNTNDWMFPSGSLGKAKGDSFEHKNGFGHEEWLFRTEFQVDGFQYGFLEPISKFVGKYEGNTYDLQLFTMDGQTKSRYWVGNLTGVEVLTPKQKNQMTETFYAKGWGKTIEEEALEVCKRPGLLSRRFARGPYFGPNVRFSANQIKDNIYEKPILVKDNDKLITATRYILLNIDDSSEQNFSEKGFRFVEGLKGLCGTATSSNPKHRKPALPHEAVLSHNKLMREFHRYLMKHCPGDEIRRECPSNDNRVDLVRKSGSEYTFYELKTYANVRTSIRVALGQILDYAFFPSTQYAAKIIIVTDVPPNADTESYIKNLKKQLKIPLGFIYFDVNSKRVMLEI